MRWHHFITLLPRDKRAYERETAAVEFDRIGAGWQLLHGTAYKLTVHNRVAT